MSKNSNEFVLTRKIKQEEMSDYIAVAYKINFKDKYEREHEVKRDEDTPYVFLRTAYYFDNKDHRRKEIVLSPEFRFELLPYLPLKTEEERSVFYISGASGKGKTYLLNNIIKYYKQFFPENKVYFITKNNWKVDRSLNQDYYKFIDPEDLIKNFSTPEAKDRFLLDPKKVFNNSFFIFDDIGALKVDKQSMDTIWFIIDAILENKRKSQISIAIISHVPTDYKRTALLIREIKQYIIFPQNMQVKSDRLLKAYLGLEANQLNKIVNDDRKISLWLSIDIQKRVVLTQRSAYFL